jgi:photosystem II stability/assembly factor-like uncharacterized protein
MTTSRTSQTRIAAFALVVGALLLTAGAVAERPLPQAPAQNPNITVAPALFESVKFRNLTVFSRGGRVTAVMGVASNPQLYYMGSTGGGVWQTADAGATWTNISDGFFEAASIGAIAVADSNSNVIYVGTGSACPRGNVSPGVGMYKSTDAGKTWTHIGLREAGTIGRIRVHPTNPDLVYVAVLGNLFAPNKERGVYRSSDGGKTWQLVHFMSDRTGAVDLAMDPKNPNTLIAAMWTTERKPWTINSGGPDSGLYRTTDGGNTWQRLTNGLPKGRMGRIGVSISGADSKRVYAQIEAEFDQGGVFRSDDGGTTWTRGFTGRALQQRAWYYTHIFADPVDVDTVYGLNVGAMKSTDGGKTFQNAGIATHGDHHDMWINPQNNKTIIESNDGGTTVSVNGGTWSQQLNQPTAEIYRLTVDTRWPYWVYGAQQDNSTIAVPSSNTGETYAVGGGESGWIAVDPRDFNIVYAGNYGGTMSRTDRKFGTSESVRVYADSQTGQRAADMKYRQQWNAPIKISPHNPDVVYTTSQFVHRTTNGGVDWTVISPDLTRNDKRKQDYSGGEGITKDNTGVEVYSTIFVLEESTTTPGLLWAGSDDGLIHISRDNGKTWTNVTPKDWPEGCINSIDPSVHDPARATVAMYRYRQGDPTPYLYQTNDYGKTWRRIADGKNGIPNWHFTRVVREDPTRRGLLYAGTEFGFYVSFDDGAHWQSLQLNLPITPVTDIMIYRDDLIVTTQGRAFWILGNLTPLRTAKPGMTQVPAAILFKPEDGYRVGTATGPVPAPSFYYWLRDAPTSPVTVEILDSQGKSIANWTAQPGTGPISDPSTTMGTGTAAPAAPAAAGGRGGDVAAGGGGGAAGGGRGGGGRGGGGRGGGGGGGEAPEGGEFQGRGGPPPSGPAGNASAIQGMNRAVWTNMRYPAIYTQPPNIVMWGGGPSAGPKVAPGMYTVKVSTGSWSETQTFRLKSDPRLTPIMTDAEGAEQLRLGREVGGQINELYTNLLKIRDVKRQAAEMSSKAGAGSPVAAAAKTLTDRLTAVESDMTQIQGEGGQDALNFPGRLDNQLVVLYGNIVNAERRLGSPVTERYKDLKPETDKTLLRARTALETDVATSNAVATKAGLQPIVVK